MTGVHECVRELLELVTQSARATGNCWSGWREGGGGSNVTLDRWVGVLWGLMEGWIEERQIGGCCQQAVA